MSVSYKVDGNSFFPHYLIEDASIVDQDVNSTKGFYSFLKGSLRHHRNNNPFKRK